MALTYTGFIMAALVIVAVPLIVWALNKVRRGLGWMFLALFCVAIYLMNQ
jgi:hypothetical protein